MIFRQQEEILIERFDNELLVFDLKKNLPYALNGMASFIFINTDGKMSQEEIARRICQKYDVSFDRALNDTRQFHEDLIQKRILKRVG